MTPILVVLAIALGGAVAAIWRARARTLRRLRDDWGAPVNRIRRMDAVLDSHRSRARAMPMQAALDDRTWDDLNLDDVFAALDRTESTLGQHALYHRLRSMPAGEHLDRFEALVTALGADVRLRERAQLALARLQDPHGYNLWWLGAPDAVETRPWHMLFPILTAVTLSLLIAAPFAPYLVPALLVSVVTNVAVRYWTASRVGVIADAFRQVAPVIAAAESLRFLAAGDDDLLVGALRRDVPSLRRLKTIARWLAGDPFMLSLRAGAGTVLINDVVTAFYEYLNLGLLLNANAVYFGAGELRVRGAALLRVAAAAGEVDAALSIASVRAGRPDWCRPSFGAPPAPAALASLCHPLVADAVPNSIRLEPGHGVLVTGSNMSGKSTFLRTVGVTAVMAQTLNTCFAERYQAPILCVRSCIGRADDLLAGRSYYIAEVESLLALVRASAGAAPHLFLLDELFRGTNAVERIAAGQAVLRELVLEADRPKTHVVIAATHDGELVDLLAATYAPYHFGDAMGADGLTFDYRLQSGRATTRNAIALLKLHGAPEGMIRQALSCAASLDRERGTTLLAR